MNHRERKRLLDAYARQLLKGEPAGQPVGLTSGMVEREPELVAVACPVCSATMTVTPEQAAHPILPCSTVCEDRAAARDEAEGEQRDLEQQRELERLTDRELDESQGGGE